MQLKEPKTFLEQVEILKSHGMIVPDSHKASLFLEQINYYRFTGYALKFRKDETGERYLEGTNFDSILPIYNFDIGLRNCLRPALEKIEIYARTQIAYWFSVTKNKNTPYMAHYDNCNFYDKKQFQEVLSSLDREEKHNQKTLFVQHHKKNYGNKMPLWVMVELLSFSNLAKLYNAMWLSEKDLIAQHMGAPSSSVLKNHLLCLTDLRNKCAHAARLYGDDVPYNPPAKLPDNILRRNPMLKPSSLFSYILVLLRRLPDMKDKSNLVTSLESLINAYRPYIDLYQIGFTDNYLSILCKQVK